jgi:molecular chaperone HscA
MDKQLAFEFLKSLIERIEVKPENGKHFLPGNLSSRELEALDTALEALGGEMVSSGGAETKPVNTDTQTTEHDETQINTEPSAVKLDPELVLKSLESGGQEEEGVLLCIDFGTAMSKSFATIVEDGEAVDELPLKLGARAKQGGGLIYPVPSSIWIADDGHIFLGQKAVALSLYDTSGKRQRFDSLKKELTMGSPEVSLDKIQLPQEINPTGVSFSKADAITLYLAYITDLAGTELEESYSESRYAPRRFALPSWPAERRSWGEKMLTKMLAKAQIVADTLHNRWEDGISIEEAKAVLVKVDTLADLPVHLIREGVSEPLASGSSRLKRDEPARDLVMVVDVGAGTSDMALFVVAEDPEKEIYNAFPIKNGNKSLSMAGDALDGAIINIVREKERLDRHHPDLLHIMAGLRMRTRALKEDIFRNGSCTYVLSNGSRGTITLEEFIQREEVKKFKDLLTKTFDEVLAEIDHSFIDRFKNNCLTVVLTGGGATLPMVMDLAEGKTKVNGHVIDRAQAPLVPQEYENDPEIRVVYPQLAVAIGGSLPKMINEKNPLSKMPGLPGHINWQLGRTQMTGL